jgi:hypothetical protein
MRLSSWTSPRRDDKEQILNDSLYDYKTNNWLQIFLKFYFIQKTRYILSNPMPGIWLTYSGILEDMMLFLNWTRAAILYEDDYGLIRLVISFQDFSVKRQSYQMLNYILGSRKLYQYCL